MRVIRYRSQCGNVHGLEVKKARKFIHVVLMQQPIRVTKLPLSDSRFITEIDYPIRKCKQHLRAAAKQWHNTLSQNTKQALRN